MIGGGPRAFTKYEAGTVKPSASVVSLLRILDANPTAMIILRGNRPQPLPAAATGPFEVTGDHVAALTERLLPELLRRLLSAEAQAHQLPADGIHVASNIHAADGGEDGRITWTGGPNWTPYLPSRRCRFQLKAGAVPPAAAGRDALTSGGTVKRMVREGLEAGGHYIMLTTHRYTQRSIEQREARIRTALVDAGLTIDDSQVQVRDGDQIAAWATSHPAVATWLREQTQPGTTGPFRPWSNWAGRPEHDGSPWVEDERLAALRDWLLERVDEPRSSARVVGRAGVGKSRLVNEALWPAEDDGRIGLPPSDLVLYAVESEVGAQPIYSAVQRLADTGKRAVVVVDHCTARTHTVLTGTVLRQGSRLSLITISDHMPDESPDQATFTVDEAPPAVIEAIISRAAPGLPYDDHRRLARFARGFPEIALRIGLSWGGTVALARATDDSLVDAYVLGREPCDRELLLKIAKLLAAFGAVRVQPPANDELPAVASLASGLAETDLRSAVTELVRRSAVKRRGGLVIVQPLAIALNLAERQWRTWSPAQWDSVLTGGVGSDLQVRAARQLAFLNTSGVSAEVLDHVRRFGGPFEGLTGILNTGHAEVLSSLAEVDPEVVGRQIEYSLGDVENLGQIRGDSRRHLVRALEKVAFDPDAFDVGAGLLLRLAAEENETWSNNATGQFAALFPVLLGNTSADGDVRLAFLDEAIAAKEAAWNLVIVDALIAGCQTSGFSRMAGPEAHGSRPTLQPWFPPNQAAATAYIKGCVERLMRFAALQSDAGVKARAGLGTRLRSLIASGLVDIVEAATHNVLRSVEVWSEAVESLGRFLAFDAKSADSAISDRVRSLMTTLEPTSLQARARFIVTEMPWDYLMDEEHHFDATHERQVKAVRELAAEFVTQPQQLMEVLPQLSQGPQRLAFVFGEALAELSEPPHVWLEPTISALTEVPTSNRNYDLLSGFVVGSAKAHPQTAQPTKERIAQSPELAPSFPVVCWNLGISSGDISLAIGAIRRGCIDPRQLRQWCMGGVLTRVAAPAVASLLDELFDHSVEAFAVALELMGMYAHGRSGALEDLRPQVLKAAESISQWNQIRGETMAAHDFEQIMTWILSKGRQDPDACAAALTLSRALIDDKERIDKVFIESLVPCLLSDFPEIAWSLIGKAIVSDPTWAWSFRYVLGSSMSSNGQDNPAILSLPEEVLFAWCYAHPESAPQFAATVVPVLAPQQTKPPRNRLHSVMARLLDSFGDRQPVLDAVASSIHTVGWTGSVTTYFARYEEPLQALFDHREPRVRLWARRMLSQVRSKMDQYRKEDEDFEAQGEMYG